jgi:hypothetical protein
VSSREKYRVLTRGEGRPTHVTARLDVAGLILLLVFLAGFFVGGALFVWLVLP